MRRESARGIDPLHRSFLCHIQLIGSPSGGSGTRNCRPSFDSTDPLQGLAKARSGRRAQEGWKRWNRDFTPGVLVVARRELSQVKPSAVQRSQRRHERPHGSYLCWRHGGIFDNVDDNASLQPRTDGNNTEQAYWVIARDGVIQSIVKWLINWHINDDLGIGGTHSGHDEISVSMRL